MRLAILISLSLLPLLGFAEKPNVVLVITDDQGYGDLGFTGNPVIKTPHMDALAAESVRLEDYHVAPTCSPTRSSLLTGHWTNRAGAWHTINARSFLREKEITLGQLLKDSGYETGMFGKWHLGDNYPYRPEDRGFTEVYRHCGGGLGHGLDPWDNCYFDDSFIHNGETVQAKGFCTDAIFKAGNEFIRKSVAEKKPFFAYISTNAPHGPLHCPQEYLDMYKGQTPELASFFGMITNIDDNVAKTRALLRELGAEKNTIFIFTTDNGTAAGEGIFNAGMKGKKSSPYDGGHRVPFFMHWPAGGMDAKHAVTEITHAVDIVPTLLDLTGSRKPDGLKFDGVSLRPLLGSAADADWPERFLVSDSQRVFDPVKWRQSAVMSNQWRLVNGEELYDIKADPGQEANIAKQHPGQVAKMRAFYEAWWAELEPTFAETTDIYLGQPGHEKVSLSAHDWMGNPDVPWNQARVRMSLSAREEGAPPLKHDSYWSVKVITPGTYEISALRWPEDANHPITAPLPAGENVPGASKAFRAHDGFALPATAATLRIDGKDIETKQVGADDKMITFTAELEAGTHRLAPFFQTKFGEVGAYYTIVTKK